MDLLSQGVVASTLVFLAVACATSSTTPTEAPEALSASRPGATPEVLVGERLLVDGRLTEARAAFEEAIADDANDARAWLDLGLVFEEQGDRASAESAYRRAVEIDPRFAQALNNLGLLLRERGELDEAVVLLERAVALDPNLAVARFNLALGYEEQERHHEAEAAYLATIRELPSDPVPRINLAMMYLDLGRAGDARGQLEAARPGVAGDVLLSIAVGEGLRRAGAPEEAVEVLRSALERSREPPPTELLAELALAYYASGDLDAAEATMRRALRQNEIDPALHYAYAAILAKQGQVGRAKTHFRRAIQLDPDGPYAERSRVRLRALN